MTRPDIASAVRAVARFCENPGLAAHKKAVLKIMQYMLHGKEWNGGSRTVGRVVDSTWKRKQTRILGLAWILDARYRVR